jgi:hypothetical protein
MGCPKKVLILWLSWELGFYENKGMTVFQGSPPHLAVAVRLAKEEALLWPMAGAKGLSFLHAQIPTV